VDAVSDTEQTALISGFLLSDPTFYDLVDRPAVDQNTAVRPVAASDWMMNWRRQLFTYLYLSSTLQTIFAEDTTLSTLDTANGAISKLEALAEARRRLEIDPAAGWRGITAARGKLQLDRQVVVAAAAV
jgi:hypothetical protein